LTSPPAGRRRRATTPSSSAQHRIEELPTATPLCVRGTLNKPLCPTYTFFATAVPLFQLGALPVLVDCNEDGSIDLSRADELITGRTRALVVTHMWGLPCLMDSVKAFCSDYQLALVEDCSHAHGASFDGQLVGTFGEAGVWSLQTQKLVAAGEGGVLLTNNRAIYDRSMLLGHFNRRAQQEMDSTGPLYKYSSTGLGLKYRAHPLGIAFALGQLSNLADWVACKQGFANELAAIARLIPGTQPIGLSDERRISAYYALVLKLSDELVQHRDRLVAAVHAEGFIDLDVPRATSPLHTLAAFREPISPVHRYAYSPLRARTYPVADGLARSTVKLSVPAVDDKVAAHFVAAFEAVVEKLVEHGFAL
jgi:perosamine synthetase